MDAHTGDEEHRQESHASLHLASFLRSERDWILDTWERLERPVRPEMPRRELCNHIPAILDAIVNVAQGFDGTRAVEIPKREPREHAKHRLERGFTLQQLTREYALLRKIILSRMASRVGELHFGELVLLNECIDQAIVEGVDEYTQGAMQTLNEEKQRLKDILEQMPAAVFIAEAPSSNLLFANRQASRLLERSPDLATELRETLGFNRLRPGESPQRGNWPIERAIRNGEVVQDEELAVQRNDGSLQTFRFSTSPLRDSGGRITSGLLSLTDVTEYKRIQGALQESEQRLRLVMDALPVLVCLVDPEQRYQILNKASEKTVGSTVQSMRGKRIPEVVGEQNYSRLRPFIVRALAGEQVTFQLPWVFPDGGLGFLEATYIPERSVDNKVTGFVGIISNVTERVKRQEEAKSRAAFEHQLIGIVSHDLRNPVSAIIMSAATVLRREGLDERLRQALGRIISSAERADRMIRDLLDFTRVRLGKGIPIERVCMNVHEFIEQVLDEVRISYPDREITVEESGGGEGAFDPDRIAQVVTNLLTNALHYGPADLPVKVRTRGEGEWIELSVWNGGAPIAPSVLPHIFEPLKRGTAIKAGRSIGLGLFIVRHIVEAHDGMVEVHSTDEDGTTVTVRLPRKPLRRPPDSLS